jgi:hypothetical protein
MKMIPALALTGALALAAAPAIGAPPQAKDKTPHGKAYGVYCKDQSKKKAEGQDKSDFAKCVTAMAKAAHNDSVTAREACAALSKKHTKGEKGTPFSRCRVGVAQMRKDQAGSTS